MSLIASSLLGALGASASTAGGSLFDWLLGNQSAKESYDREKKLARENRAWMERMSNTAHQREVKDLRAAGLNPILSATGGAGAAVPSASTSAASTSVAPSFASSISTGLEAAQRVANVNMTQAQIENLASATDLTREKIHTERQNALLRQAQKEFEIDKKVLTKHQALENLRKSIAEADVAEANRNYRLSPRGASAYERNEEMKSFGRWTKELGPLYQLFQSFDNAMGPVR